MSKHNAAVWFEAHRNDEGIQSQAEDESENGMERCHGDEGTYQGERLRMVIPKFQSLHKKREERMGTSTDAESPLRKLHVSYFICKAIAHKMVNVRR